MQFYDLKPMYSIRIFGYTFILAKHDEHNLGDTVITVDIRQKGCTTSFTPSASEPALLLAQVMSETFAVEFPKLNALTQDDISKWRGLVERNIGERVNHPSISAYKEVQDVISKRINLDPDNNRDVF